MPIIRRGSRSRQKKKMLPSARDTWGHENAEIRYDEQLIKPGRKQALFDDLHRRIACIVESDILVPRRIWMPPMGR